MGKGMLMKISWLALSNSLTVGLLLAVTACQEKIAPELSAAGVTTTGGATGGTSGGSSGATHNFALTLGLTPTNEAPPELLNYRLHKANDLVNATCAVADVVDTPDDLSNSPRDITCFVEAEEWALYHNGLNFQMSADANTCDYMVYKPYSFQRYQAGITARQDLSPRVMARIECTPDITASYLATIPPAFGFSNPNSLTLGQLCGRTFNVTGTSITATSTNVGNTKDGAQSFCSYDYSQEATPAGVDKGPNCDEGAISYSTVVFSVVEDAGGTQSIAIGGETDLHRCGGNVRACTAGPMPVELANEWTARGVNGKFTATQEAAKTVEYKVDAPYSLGHNTNFHIANFTRQCSGVGLWNLSSSFLGSANSYNPDLIAEYTELGAKTDVVQETDARGFDVVIISDDPFRAGLAGINPNINYSVEKFSSEPHYQFLCLDKAFDIKARIRVAVREWNKNFLVSLTSLAFVSDVFNDAFGTAKMDGTFQQTVPHGPWINYNDRLDWDDFLRWDDSGGTAACTTSEMLDSRLISDPLYKTPRTRDWFPELDL